MPTLLVAFALVCAAALGCGGALGPVRVLRADDPEALAYLAAHNRARATATPKPSPPLAPMRWSAALAREAAKTAARCHFDHGGSDYGENLVARRIAHPPRDAVAIWMAEQADWDPIARRCRAGRSCGHYTQVVWRESDELGCASRQCEHGSPMGGGEWFLTVCNYAPAGNEAGRAPY
ncbi:MAG: CAP domain-containing protein [Myxococcota bacterium]